MTRGSSQSVFDELTSAIVSGKRGAAKSAGLTPVGFEKTRAAPSSTGEPVTNLGGKHAAMFPYDDPQTVHNAIREGIKLVESAQAELGHVRNSLSALAELYGLGDPVAEPEAYEDPVKVAEREADARHAASLEAATPFDRMMAEKQAAAQAAVFTSHDHRDMVEDDDEPDIGWQCPDHGDEDLFDKVGQRTGRKYRVCQVAGCKQFQK